MKNTETLLPPAEVLSGKTLAAWRMAQILVWLIGMVIFCLLLFLPEIGIHAFWNVLIPVAPALLVLAPGLWRNVCPLASTALFARHLGLSQRKRLSTIWQGRLNLIGVMGLFAIVPLRHVLLDTSGFATAVTLGIIACVAILMGMLFEWKSGWCSGLCPVHPVEKLYGGASLLSFSNAHCNLCQQCVSPCPDSTALIHPFYKANTPSKKWSATLLVGGFPGFIIGWFYVQDHVGKAEWHHIAKAYELPFLGFILSLGTFFLLRKFLPEKREMTLIHIFAAAAVSSYYWFRLPALVGFGIYPVDGMLIDLQTILPHSFPLLSRVVTTSFFFWWLVLRSPGETNWAKRPPYVNGKSCMNL